MSIPQTVPLGDFAIQPDTLALFFHGEVIGSLSELARFEVSLFDRKLGSPELHGGAKVATRPQTDSPGGSVILEYSLCDANDPPGNPSYRASQKFEFRSNPSRIERRLTIQRQTSGAGRESPHQLLSAALFVEGTGFGDPERVRISAPMMRIVPATPLKAMMERPREFRTDPTDGHYDTVLTAPDFIPGTVTLERESPRLFMAVTPLPDQCAVQPRIYGQESKLVIEHEFRCESWVREGDAFEVAAEVIHVSRQPWREALPAVGRYLKEHGFAPVTDRPDWARNVIIYEMLPGFYGGCRKFTEKLDRIQGLGFNTLYLMPWHRGTHSGYGTIDYLTMEPNCGTFDDLRALSDAAHQRGMHVLFDLLVSITSPESPYLQQHPDWFYTDSAGNILPHSTWKNACFDPASPGWRQFLKGYAVRCCEEWGADGFRVDAAGYRGPRWNNAPGLQPHQHAHALWSLMIEIRDAIRMKKPDAILMQESFGPIQATAGDLVCYQWLVWLDWALDNLLAARFDGATIQRIMAENLFTMPTGVWFTFYTHTHDTEWPTKRDLEGPPVSALFATLAFLGAGIMVFGGGLNMHERPRLEEENEYRALFAAKTKLGGIAGDEVQFPQVSDPALFVAERPSKMGRVWVVTNFGNTPRALPVSGTVRYTRCGSPLGQIVPYDTLVIAPA